jgi:hypothetical protein
MIARIRGEHDARWGRWLPTTAREAAVPPRLTANVVDRQRGASRPLHRPVLWRPVAIGVSTGVCVADMAVLTRPTRNRVLLRRAREISGRGLAAGGLTAEGVTVIETGCGAAVPVGLLA